MIAVKYTSKVLAPRAADSTVQPDPFSPDGSAAGSAECRWLEEAPVSVPAHVGLRESEQPLMTVVHEGTVLMEVSTQTWDGRPGQLLGRLAW